MSIGWVWFGAGVFVGAWFGMLVMALAAIAKDADERRPR